MKLGAELDEGVNIWENKIDYHRVDDRVKVHRG